jgi:hypothetical protein
LFETFRTVALSDPGLLEVREAEDMRFEDWRRRDNGCAHSPPTSLPQGPKVDGVDGFESTGVAGAVSYGVSGSATSGHESRNDVGVEEVLDSVATSSIVFITGIIAWSLSRYATHTFSTKTRMIAATIHVRKEFTPFLDG